MLQVACIAHFQQAPLTHLAAAMMSSSTEQELQQLLEQLPEAQAAFIKQQVLRSHPQQVSPKWRPTFLQLTTHADCVVVDCIGHRNLGVVCLSLSRAYRLLMLAVA